MLMQHDGPVFEIYPNGDPYTRTWDATEYKDEAERATGIGVYRGDINHLFTRNALIHHLRRNYPGCRIHQRR